MRPTKRDEAPSPSARSSARVIEPVTARRGFAKADLIAVWPEIVGPLHADCTAPEKIVWPRHGNADEPARRHALHPRRRPAGDLRPARAPADRRAGQRLLRLPRRRPGPDRPGSGRLAAAAGDAEARHGRPRRQTRLASSVADVEDDGLRAALAAPRPRRVHEPSRLVDCAAGQETPHFLCAVRADFRHIRRTSRTTIESVVTDESEGRSSSSRPRRSARSPLASVAVAERRRCRAGDLLVTPAQAETSEEMIQPGPLGDMALGDPKAPNVVIEYASMTCTPLRGVPRRQSSEPSRKSTSTPARSISSSANTRSIRWRPRRSCWRAAARRSATSRWSTSCSTARANGPSPRIPRRPSSASSARPASPKNSFNACLTNQEILDGVHRGEGPRLERVRRQLRRRPSSSTARSSGGELSLEEIDEILARIGPNRPIAVRGRTDRFRAPALSARSAGR